MNVILFDPDELARPLPRADRRAVHVLEVLRRKEGETFDAAVINGRRGKATLARVGETALELTFHWDEPALPRPPITLLVGLPRPQTARDILRDATTVGVGSIHFVRTEKSEPSYAHSKLWESGEWRRHLVAGAEQAFDSSLPEVTFGRPLSAALTSLEPGANRFALDNYESGQRLSAAQVAPPHATLAVGGERGWSAGERAALRGHGFTLVDLGPRVLRTETACIAALAILRAKLGLM